MWTDRTLIFGLACALTITAGARSARACELMSNVFETWPADGPLAINAFAVFTGTYIHDNPEKFTVLVNGQPVEAIVSQHLSGENTQGFDQIALRPLDPPPIGASWSVKFNEKLVGTFTVTAADHTPPAAPPASMHFDVDDFASSVCSSCIGSAVNYWPHFPQGAEDGGAPLVHAIYLGHPDAADDKLFAVRRVGPQTPLRASLRESWFADDVPVTEGVCVTLRLLDLAGNEAASALRSCKPCHARIDPMQEQCFGVPVNEEPAWTDADLFPGGSCQADSAPPLPPEGFPEPDPGTTGDDTSTGDTATSDITTTGDTSTDTTTDGTTSNGITTGVTTTGDTTTDNTTTGDTTTDDTTSSTTSTTGEDTATPTTSSTLEPTTAGPGATTTDGSSSDSGDTAEAGLDKTLCGCRGEPSSPAGLALLLLAGLRRRSRRS